MPHCPYLARATALAPGFAQRAGLWDRERRYCHENVRDLVASGLMGMTIPQAYGGPGLPLARVLPVIEIISAACALTGRIVVEGNMGALSAVMAHGSDAQKRRWADAVLGGDKPALCLREAGGAPETVATRVPGGWRLDGVKTGISGAGVARQHLVFAQTEDGLAGFLTEPGPGLRVSTPEETVGLRGLPEAEIVFEAHFVPEANRLDAPAEDLLAACNTQRLGVGTMALGVAAEATLLARDELLERLPQGPSAEIRGLKGLILAMDSDVTAGRVLLWDAAKGAAPDRGKAAKANLMASETAIRVVDQAVHCFGAEGGLAAEPLERMARDLRMVSR